MGPSAGPKSTGSGPSATMGNPKPPGSTGGGAGLQAGAGPGDAGWAREWEKIDVLARAWRTSDQDRKHLLRGEKLKHARAWLASSRGKDPAPRPEHRAFLSASVRAAQMRTARNVILTSAAIGGIAVVGVKLWATDPRPVAVTLEPIKPPDLGVAVELERPPVDSVAVAATAVAHAAAILDKQPEVATLLAVEALRRLPERSSSEAAESILRRGVAKLRGVPLRGHDATITDVAMSPNGRYAITASQDQSARLWDMNQAGVLRSSALRRHGDALTRIAVTPDSSWLFTAARDGTLVRWNLRDDHPNTTALAIQASGASVTAMRLSADGRWLVSGGQDGFVTIWSVVVDPPVGRRVREGHSGPVRAVDITPDGSYVASGGEDGVASVWNVVGGEAGRRTRLDGHEGAVLDVAIAADHRWVMTGSDDHTARLWDPSRRIPAVDHRILQGHAGRVTQVEITPDGTLGLSAGEGPRIMVWNLRAKDPELNAVTFALHEDDVLALATSGPNVVHREGEVPGPPRIAYSASRDGTARTLNLDHYEREQDSVVLEGHGVPVTVAAPSPDGRWLLTGGSDGSVRLWDHQERGPSSVSRVARGHHAPVVDIAINVVGTRMVTASADGTARVWDLVRPGTVGQVGVLKGHKGRVRGVAVDRDGRYAATAGEDGAILLWALGTSDPGQGNIALTGHKRAVNQVAFVPDGRALISISADHTARVWRMTQTPNEGVNVLEHANEVTAMAIDRNGERLLTGSLSTLRLWDLRVDDIAATGRTLADPSGSGLHELDILTVGIGPDGRWAISASADPLLVLWNLVDGSSTRLRLHQEAVDSVAFSADGRWLATGSRDKTIRLWDLSTPYPGDNSQVLAGHTERVASLAFSADGKVLFSGSYDHTLRAWPIVSSDDPRSISDRALVLDGHSALVSAFDVSADGQTVVSASYDGSARVWPLHRRGLSDIACRRVGRDLTPDEWSSVFTDPYRSTCTPE